MSVPGFRTANESDLVALRDLERAANLVALAHVFPPERYPYPDDDVLARWRIVLDDPDCTTLVVDDPVRPGDLLALLTYDVGSIRHLAVHPSAWGTGLARLLLAAACGRVSGPVRLWCLVDNHRARGLYEHLGWRATGRTGQSEFPPYPVEMEYVHDPR